MDIFMFVLSCLTYFFIITCMVFVIKEYADCPIGAIFAAIIGVMFGIFVKPLLYIWFFNLFIAPLLPFELTIPYWSMVAICFFSVFLNMKVDLKKH